MFDEINGVGFVAFSVEKLSFGQNLFLDEVSESD